MSQFGGVFARLGFATAVICAPASGYQQPVPPDTAAGRVFNEWLKAFNSGDPAAITAFNNNHRRQPRPPGQTLNLREQTRGFTRLRVEKSEKQSITVLLQERNTDQLGRLEIVVDSEEPPKTVRESLIPASHPPQFAIPRLAERAALDDLAAYAQQAADGDRFS